jgi:hypothetical protein
VGSEDEKDITQRRKEEKKRRFVGWVEPGELHHQVFADVGGARGHASHDAARPTLRFADQSSLPGRTDRGGRDRGPSDECAGLRSSVPPGRRKGLRLNSAAGVGQAVPDKARVGVRECVRHSLTYATSRRHGQNQIGSLARSAVVWEWQRSWGIRHARVVGRCLGSCPTSRTPTARYVAVTCVFG